MKARLTTLTAAASSLALTAASAYLAYRAGWRINLTASEPRGPYRLLPIGRSPLARGTLVALCPPEWVRPAAFPFYLKGDCPGGGRVLLKALVGVPGDRVEVSSIGVRINGALLPESAPQSRSGRYPNILLPRWRGELVLGPEQYWVYGGGARRSFAAMSFDSRYFGPVLKSQLRARATGSAP